MKTLLLASLIMSIVSSIPIGSCEEVDRHDNNGYKSDVSFGREGDTIVLAGKKPFESLDIRTEDDMILDFTYHIFDPEFVNDTCIVSAEWLTLKTVKGSHSLTLISAPNTTGVERHLKVVGYLRTGEHCDVHATIYVKQKK